MCWGTFKKSSTGLGGAGHGPWLTPTHHCWSAASVLLGLLLSPALRAYVSQYDLHHAEMTVRETINFSSKMLGTNNEFGKTYSCV